jgi:predicted hydrocarbon binding protein
MLGDAVQLPASYCLCSAGWVQEMFETVTGRPVHVELIRSIKGGAPDCRFVVRL